MKSTRIVFLSLLTAILTSCGSSEPTSKEESGLSADRGFAAPSIWNPGTTPVSPGVFAGAPRAWYWHPYGVAENCVQYSTEQVTDIKQRPPVTYTAFRPYIWGACSAHSPAPEITITRYDGQRWNGEEATVQIRAPYLNKCLHNAHSYSSLFDDGALEWRPCVDVTTLLENRRQLFHVRGNANGAVTIMSEHQYTLGLPNAQPECIRQKTPNILYRTKCDGLGYWMFTRRN